jgi:Fe-S-cluster-containing dehydrogenase component
MISAGDKRPEAGSANEHFSRDNDYLHGGPGTVDGTWGRHEIIQETTLKQYLASPTPFEEHAEGGAEHKPENGHTERAEEQAHAGADLIPGQGTQPNMLDEWAYTERHKWGMTIDMQSCIGCNACVMACTAENNVPVVGKEQVLMSREMHWLRIDTYYKGDVDDPETYFQPMLCVHCEKAPCEIVCPVGATVHSAEGTNDMVYNRCVGTRYCSNNCPYKVRRFNFLHYADQSPLAQLRANPNVTIRWRGVMEKCTYCIQRVWRARINAEKENRTVRDGEVITACQQSCPTEAIVFGNLADPEARVVKLKKTNLNYGVLAELNTQPRTTHLSRVTNPNPELEA